MNKFVKIIALSLLPLALAAAKPQQDYKGMVVVKSNTMAERGDTLDISFDVWVQRHCVEDFAAMRLTPKIVTADTARVFSDIVIQGDNKRKTYDRWLRTMSKRDRSEYTAPGALVRINSQTDTVLRYDVRVPYEMWMDDAVLAFNQELITYNDERALVVFALDGRVKLSPRVPYQVKPEVSFTEPAREQKTRKMQGSAYLDFVVGKSNIIPSYRRNPAELAKIQNAFLEIENNKDVQISGLFIEGYASPEGSYPTNERLSRERAAALKNYIMSNFRVPLSEQQIRVSSVAEDWEGLKAQIEASSLKDKDAVLATIENTPDPDQREAKLRALSGGVPWRAMLTGMFPSLRRVEYQIDFSVKDFSESEARDLIGKNSEMLSQRELYLVAQYYGRGSREYDNIMLEIIPRQFPKDPVANINAAALMLEGGDAAAAKRTLEKYADNPASWNNLGAAELMLGNLDAAQAWFEKAAGAGIAQAQHNLNEVKLKREDDIRMERYKNR